MIADRVKQTATAPGTGQISFDASVPGGFRSFVSGIGNGNSCFYAITDAAGNWEVGQGVVSSGSPDTLTRATVLASSNSGSLVNFSLSVTVFCTAPASVLDVLSYKAQGTLDFGSPGETYGTTVTVSAPWVTSSMVLMPTLAAAGTTDHPSTDEDTRIENIQLTTLNIVPGVGFDIAGYAPDGTWGQYLVTVVAR